VLRRRDGWENLAHRQPGPLVVLPWALAVVFVNQLFQAYDSLTAPEFSVSVLFGAGWGIAQY
jgi:hypothetical protein